jgi:hypothetical protein
MHNIYTEQTTDDQGYQKITRSLLGANVLIKQLEIKTFNMINDIFCWFKCLLHTVDIYT